MYIVKLGYAGLYLFLLQNIGYGYSLEPPRGGSNVYPQVLVRTASRVPTINVLGKIIKNINFFSNGIFNFLLLKNNAPVS